MRFLSRTITGRVILTAAATWAIAAVTGVLIAAVLLAGRGEGSIPAGGVARAAGVALAIGTIVVAVIAVPLASAIASTITRPIERVARRAELGTVSRMGWSPGDAPAEVVRLANAVRLLVSSAADRYALAEAERDRSATLLRGMGDAVLIFTADDLLELANPAAERLLGVTGAAGRTLAEVARDHELLATVDQARREGSASSQIDRLDPRRSIRVAAWRLPAGDVLVTAQDLTNVRRLETVRRDFVANVSHELRTPIASIKAMVETLESGALRDPDAASDFVARIHREVDDLAQVVTELLSLARIESGAEELELRPADPIQLMRTAADRMRALSERAGIRVSVAPSHGLPPVLADREKIATVLVNLIHNAIKFTPTGGSVTLGAAPEDGAVAFSVRDTGIGIGRDDLDRIFERFYKSDTARSEEGTGLGLAIARHIVIAHGGAIRAESEGPGRGSLFRFTVPAVRPPRTEVPALDAHDLRV